MIRILKESDIPIPLPLLDKIMDDIKSHIVSWIHDTFIDSLNEMIKNSLKSKEDKEIFESIIEKQKEKIETFKNYYSGFIKDSEYTLGNFSKNYSVLNYLPSGYKYSLPVGFDDYLGVIHYFDISKGGVRGEYLHFPKTITIYNYVWKEFLEDTRYLEKYNQFQIRDLEKFFKQIDNYILSIKGIVAHELVHYVQVTFIPQARWKLIHTKDSTFDKYVSSEMEFYPRIKNAYYDYLRDYGTFNRSDFEKFVSKNDFFYSLKKIDIKQYNRAIKQLYMVLQNI